ncbi:MAG TPA: PEGA domain-containing protein, partial [Spirochaetota bacterium]|nr:PEGA domain-containing protein [Spirochaetota bacterium]HRX48422.1 PEGA domain-containing protein [Spirochaetota bacterium]
MTVRKQWMYIIGLFMVFLIVIPVILLYSFGYRVSSDFKLVKTGGIYFANQELDASVYLNGKMKKTSGIFERNLLVQNIKPGNYHVKMTKEGYRTWQKWIQVQEQKVEACFPLLIPEELNVEEIKKYLPSEVKDTKKKKHKRELNDEYTDVAELFKIADKPVKRFFPQWNSREIAKLKLGVNRKLRGKVLLTKERNNLYVIWTGKQEQLPFFINTMKKKRIYSPGKTITAFDFFPARDDSFIVRFSDGSLYAVEIDTRFGEQNSYRILKYCDRFLVDGDILYYYRGSRLFKINFEI